jgi:hypothetical protein
MGQSQLAIRNSNFRGAAKTRLLPAPAGAGLICEGLRSTRGKRAIRQMIAQLRPVSGIFAVGEAAMTSHRAMSRALSIMAT